MVVTICAVVENGRKTMKGWLARTLRRKLKALGFERILEN
jgi:hypothetical protein